MLLDTSVVVLLFEYLVLNMRTELKLIVLNGVL